MEAKSMLVPSVQELANGCLERVPERYIRPFDDQDRPIAPSDHHDGDLQLPIINMEALLAGDQEELQKLHFACQEWGFFQLINHGVSLLLLEKLKTEIKEFFNLPMEEKKRYWQTTTDMEGFGQVFVVSDEQKLEWGDVFLLNTLPKHQRNPRLWPSLPLPYREIMENYATEIANLVQKIFECMGETLNLDNELTRRMFGDQGRQLLRMNYFPPCPQPDKVIGLTPHSDAAALTILLQLNEIEGLQIKKDGKWILVKPLPQAFIVNIGDVLEMMTNGLYKSILHRVVVNETNERLSVAAFHTPGDDQEIGPLSNLVTAENPAKFRSINVADYLKGLFARKLEGKSYLDVTRIHEN